MLKLGVSAVAHVIELREYVVPDFHVSVAVAAGLTVGFAAAVLFTAVEVNLGAGSARSGAVFPKVVFLAEADDFFSGNADFLIPDFKRFVVVFVNRGIKKLGGNLEDFGKELPRPLYSLFLEVVAE